MENLVGKDCRGMCCRCSRDGALSVEACEKRMEQLEGMIQKLYRTEDDAGGSTGRRR